MITLKSARAQGASQRGSPGYSIYTSLRRIGKNRCPESGELGGDPARTELLPGRRTGAEEEKAEA